MVKVKICGLKRREHVTASLEAGADWLGFVHVPGSPREVSLAEARDLAAHARRDGRPVSLVALLVNPDDREIDAVLDAWQPDILQLHGQESPDRVAALARDLSGHVRLWKALPVGSADDLARAGDYAGADRLLLDAKPPEGEAMTGGLGHRFDWSLLKEAPPSMPWILAGGLTPATVGEAVGVTGADALDVSSGVEAARGQKSASLISDFLDATRQI